MSRTGDGRVDTLERLYAKGADDISFEEILRQISTVSGDEDLAEIVEADGRKRINRGLPVTLDRYLAAVDDLPSRPVALDAAIDVVLRSRSRSSRADASVVQHLLSQYPNLSEAIEEAAAFNNAMWSTSGVQEFDDDQPRFETPCEFGPTLDDNRHRYQLISYLGSGASGQVYLANDRQLEDASHEALVAIKILSTSDHSPLSRLRRSDEATRARRIDHPAVVRVIDRGIAPHQGVEYVVYEYVPGGDLGAWLSHERLPLPPREAARLVAQLACGVQAAHSAGLVHCDLKPGNVMLDREGNPKIVDFGVATDTNDTRELAARRGRDVPIGNLAFISPEQYRMDDGALSPPSDIYALGGMLYLFLTGELPNGSDVHEIARTHSQTEGRTTPPPFPRDCGVDPDLQAICHRAMAVNPNERYPAAEMIADDLQAWMANEPIVWRRPGVIRKLNLWRRRKPTLAFAVTTLILLFVVSIGIGSYALIVSLQENRRFDQALSFSESLLNAADSRPASSKLFLHAFISRSLGGPEMYQLELATRNYWLAELRALESYLKLVERRGEAQHIVPQLTKLTLALWLVSDGQTERATPLAAELRRDLPTIVHLDDPLLDTLDLLESCIEVQQIASRTPDGTLNSEDRASLAHAEQVIRTYLERIQSLDIASSPHFLALQTLKRIHSPALLNNPTQHELISQELAALRQFHPVFPAAYDKLVRAINERRAELGITPVPPNPVLPKIE